MDRKFLEGIFKKAEKKKIYIIGDVMLDKYLFGDVNRISPEAPVQVFDIVDCEYRLGGAANVCFNVKKLGADPVLVGVIGEDAEGEMLKYVIKKDNIETKGLITQKERPTTTKTRVIADSHHLIRIDSESKNDISEETSEKILELLKDNAKEINCIVLQDYNKGVLHKKFIAELIKLANDNEIKVLVDPKHFNFFEYKDTFLFKPNRKEMEEAFGRKTRSIPELESLASELADKINCKYLVLTLGEQGMMLYSKENGKAKSEIIPTFARKVADVSGAGDTVISTLAVCLAGGAEIVDAVKISNYAAGLVVEEVGIVPIEKDKLIDNIIETAGK